VVIPKGIFDAMRLQEGDFVEITVEVSMKPKRLVDADTLTPTEAKKVRHGLKQAKEGNGRHELGL
jgi:bifunctional DNA-binding transcriptional regulator/antitoxin component of YhaV-PrlF toxin-antitoxin module